MSGVSQKVLISMFDGYNVHVAQTDRPTWDKFQFPRHRWAVAALAESVFQSQEWRGATGSHALSGIFKNADSGLHTAQCDSSVHSLAALNPRLSVVLYLHYFASVSQSFD